MSDKWITFDCYGTLVDWQTGFRQILHRAVGDRVDDLVGRYHTVEPEVQAEMPDATYKAVLHDTVERAAAQADVPIAEGDLDVLARHWGELPLFPDTEAALTELRNDGWKLGVLTNCDTDLFEATRRTFPVQLDTVITTEEVGNYKPDLAHFTEFEKRSGVSRANWVHAAVSWWHDMEPARILGLRRVWVDRENSGHDAATVTRRVTDLAGLVTVTRDANF